MTAATVTARTVDFTAVRGGVMTFAQTTVLLVRMTAAQVAGWKWVGDLWAGADPVVGYELRDSQGALLGAILPLGNMATRIHVEWYDPSMDDFLSAGETSRAVLTHAIHRILDARRRNVGDVPAGRDTALDPVRPAVRHNTVCPFTYCFDADCVDHGPVWAQEA